MCSIKEGNTYLLQVNIIWLLTVFLLLQVDGQIVAILVQNMERLDENNKEEADGVHNTLGNIYKFDLIVKDHKNIDMLSMRRW